MADGAGIYRYMTESLRISKALEAFLAARHASEVQYATALAEACYTLRENVESKVETEGRLQNSPLKPAVSDLVKGTGKIADARYGFASMMKKRVLDVFAAVNVDLQAYLESQQETALRMQDYMIETVEILRKDKAAYHKNREALCEVRELVAKMQEDSPQKRKEFDRLTQKLTQSVQKMVQLNCTVQESQDQYDAARSGYINTALPKFQNDLVCWTETRANSIKDMLIQLKQLEQIAVEKAEEAVNVGKDSANAIDTQESVSQFMNAAQLSLDLAVRKSSAISIRDMKMFSKAGKLYVKRSKSPLSPWCIQYSVLQENRLVLFDGPESEHPREVILLDKIPKVIATLGSAKGQQKFENDLFWHTIVNEVQYSLFQKADCFQLIFHENASVIPISLEPKVDLSDSCSISAFQENHGALEISTEPRTNGGDRSYYFIPVDPEPSKHWIKAFVENGARSCQCGKCYEHKAKLALRIWIIEGTSIGVERGTNDNLSVTIKFGKLNMAKTLFKQGPNPVWNEEFRFDSLPSCTDSISFSVKSSLNLDNGDLDIGNICNKIDEMSLERRIESTVCFLCFPASSIKLAYLLTIHEHLGLESYKGLIESLVTPPLNAFHLFSDVLNHDNKDEFCDYYLNLLLANPPALLPALSCLTDREIRETEDPNILFRGNSTLTKILDRFMRIRGEEYVKIVLSDCIKDIYESNSKEIKAVFARMRESLKCRFPDEKHQHIGISGFLFLRLFCVAIMAPQRYGLIAHDPDVATVRKLTLITKIMQHLANFSPFGVKERHMECSNDWIASNTDAMKAFLDKISSSDINSDLSAKLEVNAPDQLSTITCVHKFLSGCAPSITSTTPGILSNETWQYNMRMVDSLDLDLEAKARKGLKVLRAMTAESKQINSNIRRTIDFQKKLDHFNHSFEKKQTEFFNASQSIPNRRKEKTKHSPIRRKSRSLESFATVTRPLSLYGIQTLVKAQMDALMNPNSKATDFEIGTSSGDDSSKNAISSPDQYRQRMTKFINRFKTAPEQSSP
ncbi:Ras GTPase-activating protein 1 [Entophlyctis sp. JEL0112]|nr:Ras GTPase-activating protein 1 [Entophlyctis sp. JEL0112]